MTRRPTLHLICGMAGAGKTTLAKKLERSLPAVRFCPDEWIMKLLEGRSDSKKNERLRDIVEGIQWATAQRLLSIGTSVILENGFWGKSERETYRDKARSLKALVVLHFLDPSDEELWNRIEKRNGDLPEGTFPVKKEALQKWIAWFQKPDQDELETYDDVVYFEQSF